MKYGSKPKISNKVAKLGSEFPVTGGVKTEDSWQFVEDDGKQVGIGGWPWKSLLTQSQGTAGSHGAWELSGGACVTPTPTWMKLEAGPVLLPGWKAIPWLANASCFPSTVELEEAQKGLEGWLLTPHPGLVASAEQDSQISRYECAGWASFAGGQRHIGLPPILTKNA